MIKNTFKKEERLCSVKLIDLLFHKGSSFVCYPYRIVFYSPKEDSNTTLDNSSSQVILSVSKRRFKRAVDRNVMKRRMRECFRLQKKTNLTPFLQEQQLPLLLAIQYVGKGLLAYNFLYSHLEKALLKLENECSKLYLAKDNQTDI
ncbi:ribonuclease P protein component [Sphingobacterium sp. SRCM116780]|uniref:ribonuclease P protein component n=1 Tax=Sphingobacterium sp. SRCM116780 TaxID=2907623 RepID=UPI001F309D77|nr:ribonuclease P protein component [Sphingobacterium sp. SRCM116780]UIR56485.1 ribonuclease P protein component [Sphingobacterium sp. SRCM116780]